MHVCSHGEAMQMSLCLVRSCLPVSLSEPTDPPLGPQQGGDSTALEMLPASWVPGHTHCNTNPTLSPTQNTLVPFSFLLCRHQQTGRGNPHRPTEWSSIACRSRSRYSVSSPECRDDRARPFILIYCQICGVDQPGGGGGTHTSQAHHSKFIKTNLPPPRGPPLPCLSVPEICLR